jgi:hypothetical protein
MPEVTLDASDAVELIELLQLLTGWLTYDPGRLGASPEEPEEFVGNPAHNIGELREDLNRFTFCPPTATVSPPVAEPDERTRRSTCPARR